MSSCCFMWYAIAATYVSQPVLTNVRLAAYLFAKRLWVALLLWFNRKETTLE